MNFPAVDNLPSLMEPLTRKAYVGIVRWLLENEEWRGIIELYDTSKDPNVNLNQMLMEDVVNQLSPIAMVAVGVFFFTYHTVLVIIFILFFQGLCVSAAVVGS